MSFIYNFIVLILAIGAIQEVSKDMIIDKLYYRLIVLIMILTAGMGYALSPDWVAYFETFKMIGETAISDIARFGELVGMESGYLYLNYFLYSMGFDFGALTLVVVTVSLMLKFSTFYRYAGYPMLALLMYTIPNYFFEEHVHIRQGLANAIAMYSVRYVIDRKIWHFLLCITIGYQFHESIIVFVLAYWIVKIRVSTPVIGVAVIVAIIANFTGLTSIIDTIMQFMPVGQDKYESYESDLMQTGEFAVGDIVKLMTVGAIMLYNKNTEDDELYIAFRNLFLMGVVLYFFLGKGIFGIRLPGYYTVFLGLVVCRVLVNLKNISVTRNFVFYSFFTYTIVLFFWLQIKQGHKSNFGNYRTFFHPTAVYGLWR
ncbi:EpsG family protein [Vaginella massiliensis]|uniref:EpsG family protein n=1 Tax=Vaginella massiliensis TaxID=1816680 RepID=UPI0037519300